MCNDLRYVHYILYMVRMILILQIPVTIEDASVYPAIKEALQTIGYAKEPA